MNVESLEVVKNFCCLSDTIGARGGTPGSVVVRLRSNLGKYFC